MLQWNSDDSFLLNGTEFVLSWPPKPTDRSQLERFRILKTRPILERYEPLVVSEHPRRIVELGIYDGGSTAFLAELAQPEKLVALDISADRCVPLEQYVQARGLSVATYYGVDQADTARLAQIVAEEFEGPLDLVVDDASHLLSATRSSFECLFPLLRPDGVYVIEDWGWAHVDAVAPLLPGQPALSILVYQAIIASARVPTLVKEVLVGQGWTVVRRGPARCERFDLSAACGELGRTFVDALSAL
jgi:SAM-dependent methyltransferase